MGFRCGIIGLPNVGKSTLFNALMSSSVAEVGNYPFCTVEPNVGRVPVPDPLLDEVASICGAAEIVPTSLEVVDIAGLVEGASQGEGLGNKFLAHVREVDALLHMVRCFKSDSVGHVSDHVDPINDISLIETELMLSDLESLIRQRDNATKRSRSGDDEAVMRLETVETAITLLEAGQPLRELSNLAPETKHALSELHLLSDKPVLYVCNVDEESAANGNALSNVVAQYASRRGAEHVLISANIESEIVHLKETAEKFEFLEHLGLKETGLDRVIHAGHKLLGLIRFMTAGPKQARAWTLKAGSTAVDAAGRIHTDFVRGFICAETIGADELIALGGEQAARSAGRMRQEGRNYIVSDGDVLLFRFNV